MEWLKEVDLAEYAPNLRGSGVHGSLMVNERKFNDELLADLLAIPANKTLLRRHLRYRLDKITSFYKGFFFDFEWGKVRFLQASCNVSPTLPILPTLT